LRNDAAIPFSHRPPRFSRSPTQCGSGRRETAHVDFQALERPPKISARAPGPCAAGANFCNDCSQSKPAPATLIGKNHAGGFRGHFGRAEALLDRAAASAWASMFKVLAISEPNLITLAGLSY